MKTSDDPLKSNMRGGHINNEHNDGMDNDSELLREGHSSHSQNIWQKWIQRMKGLGKLTYKLSSTYIINQMILEPQYTHSMIENNTHMHFFFHIYIHALNAN